VIFREVPETHNSVWWEQKAARKMPGRGLERGILAVRVRGALRIEIQRGIFGIRIYEKANGSVQCLHNLQIAGVPNL